MCLLSERRSMCPLSLNRLSASLSGRCCTFALYIGPLRSLQDQYELFSEFVSGFFTWYRALGWPYFTSIRRDYNAFEEQKLSQLRSTDIWIEMLILRKNDSSIYRVYLINLIARCASIDIECYTVTIWDKIPIWDSFSRRHRVRIRMQHSITSSI